MKIILNDGTVRECESKEEELHVLRHSAAHIMAQAIRRLFPEAIFAYGPATEKGSHKRRGNVSKTACLGTETVCHITHAGRQRGYFRCHHKNTG